jgi:hypothetical protein
MIGYSHCFSCALNISACCCCCLKALLILMGLILIHHIDFQIFHLHLEILIDCKCML